MTPDVRGACCPLCADGVDHAECVRPSWTIGATKDLVPESNAGVREAIARIVDPETWQAHDDIEAGNHHGYSISKVGVDCAVSLAKADDILSLLPASIDVGLRIAADTILALDAKSPRDLGLVRQTHANGTLGGIRHCAWIIRDSCGSGPFAADVVGKAREALEDAAADFQDHADHARSRIADGDDMDAPRVWRIALEDIAREADQNRQRARTALASLTGEGL